MNTCNYKIDIRGRDIFEPEPTVIIFEFDRFGLIYHFNENRDAFFKWRKADRGEMYIKGRIYNSDLIKIMVGRE